MTPFNPGTARRFTARGKTKVAFDPKRLVQETLARNGIHISERARKPMAGDDPKSAVSADWAAHLRAVLTPCAAADTRTQSLRRTFECDAGSRDYVLHLPSGDGAKVRGLVLMLHGCTQTPEDFAIGTGMNHHADREGLIIVYPAQARGANAQSCWNWFNRGDQHRGRGEPAILAGLTRAVMAEFGVPERQAFVAGLSAGGAMAVILGETYPDVFSAVGAHSALPFGAARDVASAFAAMAGNATPSAHRKTDARIMPTIVFHGAADATVKLVNGEDIVRHALSSEKGACTQVIETSTLGGRSCRREITSGAKGQTCIEHWVIEGMGHAWSGGCTRGSYTDPQGPDASAEMIRFFLDVAARQ
jgi:poly(hydroxyalkanoate) depolymerase family esterase